MTIDLDWYPTPAKLDWLPDDFPLNDVVQQIAHTGIYVDSEDIFPDTISGIQTQVQHAHEQGINLMVVYLNENHPAHTFLRDLADYLEHKHPGTYLVMDHHNEAVASNIYPRVVLERSELHLSLDKPDQAASQFVSALHNREFPWSICVMGMFIVAIIGAVSAHLLVRWGNSVIGSIKNFFKIFQ